MGVILSAFLLPKMAFWGDLGSFEGSDGKIVRSDCKNGSWVAKNAFSGCSLGIRGEGQALAARAVAFLAPVA